MKITPVILSGGSGTRLWPMSTPAHPKQFLALTSARTMFEQTLARVDDPARFEAPLIVANARHRALIEAQLAGRAAALFLEPAARNTAPAIALAACAAPDAMLLIMPSDHVITDVTAFARAVDAALPFADDGWLVTFGIAPDAPETGYGYIQLGTVLAKGVHEVARFVEKPDATRAAAMLTGGDHVWNGGIFLFRADAYCAALRDHAPAILAAATQAMTHASAEASVIFPDADAFAASPSDSIDYAVMEKAARVAVVPARMGWSDVGSWDALAVLAKRDMHGNALSGNIIAADTRNCMIKSDGIRIATLGLDGIIVIASGNDVLIMREGVSQGVKDIIGRLAEGDG